MFRKIKAGQYKFLAPYWDPISAEAKDFVAKLLVVNWQKRMDCEAALKHPWIAPAMSTQVSTKNLFGKTEPESSAPKTEEAGPDDLQSRLRDYNNERKVEDMSKLRKLFDLPESCERVKKYKCMYSGTYGHLHITTTHLCWFGGSKKVCVANGDVKEIKKAKRFKFTPGKGHSILISGVLVGSGKDSDCQFNGFPSRDEAYALIGEYCKAAEKK